MVLLVDLDVSLLMMKSPIFHQANARVCWNVANLVCSVELAAMLHKELVSLRCCGFPDCRAGQHCGVASVARDIPTNAERAEDAESGVSM